MTFLIWLDERNKLMTFFHLYLVAPLNEWYAIKGKECGPQKHNYSYRCYCPYSERKSSSYTKVPAYCTMNLFHKFIKRPCRVQVATFLSWFLYISSGTNANTRYICITNAVRSIISLSTLFVCGTLFIQVYCWKWELSITA